MSHGVRSSLATCLGILVVYDKDIGVGLAAVRCMQVEVILLTVMWVTVITSGLVVVWLRCMWLHMVVGVGVPVQLEEVVVVVVVVVVVAVVQCVVGNKVVVQLLLESAYQ